MTECNVSTICYQASEMSITIHTETTIRHPLAPSIAVYVQYTSLLELTSYQDVIIR